MIKLFNATAQQFAAILTLFANIAAATRVSNDIKCGRNPREFDMRALGISDAYRSYRAV